MYSLSMFVFCVLKYDFLVLSKYIYIYLSFVFCVSFLEVKIHTRQYIYMHILCLMVSSLYDKHVKDLIL